MYFWDLFSFQKNAFVGIIPYNFWTQSDCLQDQATPVFNHGDLGPVTSIN